MTMTDLPYSTDYSRDYDISGSICNSVMSFEEDTGPVFLSHSFASGTLTEMSSLFSMSEDDFDKLASRRARELFEQIDSILYEHEMLGPAPLMNECHEWGCKFLHIRVVGHQVIKPDEDGYQLYPANDEVFVPDMTAQTSFSNTDFRVHGTHMDMLQQRSASSLLPYEEELIEENGLVEEVFAIDKNEDEFSKTSSNHHHHHRGGLPPVTPFNCLKDNILSTLFDNMFKHLYPSISRLVEKHAQSRLRYPENFFAARSVTNLDENSQLIPSLPLTSVTIQNTSPSARGISFTHDSSPAQVSSSALDLTSIPDTPAGFHDSYQASLTSRNYHDKNSAFSNAGLSVVPEDFQLDGVLTVRGKELVNRERSLIPNEISSTRSKSNLFPGSYPSSIIQTSLDRPVSSGKQRLAMLKFSRPALALDRLRSPNTDIGRLKGLNLETLQGHRLATYADRQGSANSQSKSILPSINLQNRTVMSANGPNTSINRPMQLNRRLFSQRATSAIVHDKDTKLLFREKEKSFLNLDNRPSTTHTTYNRVETPSLAFSRQSTAIQSSNAAHRNLLSLPGLPSQKPNLMLTGSGIPARGEQEHEIGGNDKRRHNSGFQLNTADENSFEEVTEIDPRWGSAGTVNLHSRLRNNFRLPAQKTPVR